MNTNEQIVKYLDGRMNEAEKLHFEEILAEDPDLRKRTARIRYVLSSLKSDAEPAADETYFVNMLPGFYSRLGKRKKFLISKLAYSLSTAAAVVITLFVILRSGSEINVPDLNDINTKLSEKELNETLNQYSDNSSLGDLMNSASAETDSIVTDMVSDELDLSGLADKTVADKYINTDELLSSIDENEANQLYSQLINEDIIKGMK
ncbi:MAG TPA: hypothetical protein VI230_02285 [Ignavibacteriaceae bacterium]